MTPPLARPLGWLRNATTSDGATVDLRLEDGRVVERIPATGAQADPETDLDLTGFMLLPAPAEPHAHLDKALSYDLIQPPGGDLIAAIDAWRAHAATMPQDEIERRARAAALELVANGTTAVRSHVDMLVTDDPLRGARALLTVRDELRDLIDIELVALTSDQSGDEVIEQALALGVDLVGGAPHLADDPIGELNRLIDLAQCHGVGIDLHTDESLTGDLTIGAYLDRVLDWPDRPGTVSAGHCVRLGTLAPADLAPLLPRIVEARMGIITLPITNLYLQGWEHDHLMPRGLTAIDPLLEAGAILGAGADNVRDPFNPVGRSDALETATLLVAAAHLDLATAYRLASNGSRAVMGLEPVTLEPGSPAEFLAVRGTTLSDVVGRAPADRKTIHRGRLVAERTTTTSLPVTEPTR